MTSVSSPCVFYESKEHNENFPNKRLSIPQAVYDVIIKYDLYDTILYSTRISQYEIHFKIKPLSDEELIKYVKEFNLKLVGHRHITIMEFLTIINHYSYDGAIEIIENSKNE